VHDWGAIQARLKPVSSQGKLTSNVEQLDGVNVATVYETVLLTFNVNQLNGLVEWKVGQ
jgi:DNA-binding protein Fis